MIRQWWKRHFASASRLDDRAGSNRVERCSCCGQAFDVRDLEQVLPHFMHQLAAGGPQPEKLVRQEDLPPQRDPQPENVVPFRRRLQGSLKSL